MKEDGHVSSLNGSTICGVSVCKPAGLMTPAEANEEKDTGRFISADCAYQTLLD